MAVTFPATNVEFAALAFSVPGALGQRELSPAVYNPILDALGDHQPRTIGEIEQALSGTELRLPAKRLPMG